MIKDIVKDNFFLSQVSTDCTKDDAYIIDDLKDTLNHHQETCVGMAGNMIGYLKNIIIFYDQDKQVIMINPIVMKYDGKVYQAKESCLSHTGVKETKRYDKVKVSYLDENFKKKIKTYSGFTAQIIQHELDHLKGILI